MRNSLLSLFLGMSVCGVALGQTFAPKAVRFEGVPASEQAQLVGLSGLKPGASMTKAQIEAALQKLADSGGYSDMSYTVNGDALVVKLTPIAGNDMEPVRYGNFVWWPAEEVEQMVEARVTNFHGVTQVRGPVTDQVREVLVDLVKAKGFAAPSVEAVHDPAHGVVVFKLDSPMVVVGDLTVNESLQLGKKGGTEALTRGMRGTEFDAVERPEIIAADLRELFGDAGYLDAKADVKVVGAPRMAMGKVLVDLSATVTKGEQWHVKDVVFEGAPAGTESDLRKAASVLKGGVASPGGARRSVGDLEGELATHGYLAAKAKGEEKRDAATRTASYVFELRPGPVYTLSALDASRATPDIQKLMAKDSRLKPGVVLDAKVTEAIAEDIKTLDPKHEQKLVTMIERDAGAPTAAIVLKTAQLPPGMMPISK